MFKRLHPGTLRRELRFSRSLINKNLEELSLHHEDIESLLQSATLPLGLIGLTKNELVLLEQALGLSNGHLAVDLVGELVSVKTVPPGTGVSYGYLSETKSETNLGLVAIGFSDGIPRKATSKFSVGIDSKTHPSIGRIAMDQCVIDLGQASPTLGSEVSFFSSEYPLSTWAKDSGFSPLEILGRITSRVARTWSE
jgi:alanine racemase